MTQVRGNSLKIIGIYFLLVIGRNEKTVRKVFVNLILVHVEAR